MPSVRPAASHTGAATAHELADASLDLLRAMAAIADESLDATEPKLSLQQFRALTVLHERGPHHAARLAAALGIAPSTLTRLADRLVRDGLAVRVTDPDDRRAVLLTASRKGQRTAERVKAWRLAELARRFGALSAVDRRTLHPTVRRLGAVLQQPSPQTPERSIR